jgi:rhodanese-related sulfurtransferase
MPNLSPKAGEKGGAPTSSFTAKTHPPFIFRAIMFGMALHHSPRFLDMVNNAKQRVREMTVDDVKRMLDANTDFVLVDVREDNEWAKDHLPAAVHLGKGVIERDVEQRVPDTSTPIVLYCGGGFRSALAADALQRMGYTNVASMDGGIRDWREKGFPLARE